MWNVHPYLRVCVVGAIALFSLTSAQLDPTQVAARTHRARAHAPMIHIHDPSGQPVFGPHHESVSGNWSGYALSTGPSGNYTSASFHWRVQSARYVSYAANPYSFNDSSQWVGIGGFSTNDLIQLGSESFVSSSGTPSYYVWYEMLPADETVLPAQYTASAGDNMTASLACTANCSVNNPNSQWSLSMSDTTKGWTWTGSFTYESCLCSAEWINEAPDYGQVVGISNYGTATFSNLTVNGGSPGLSLNSDGIILEDAQGGFSTPCQAFNGAQLGNGNQFLVAYGQACASTFDSHDFNDDATSDILWRQSSGELAMWLMSAGHMSSGANISSVPSVWSVVGSRDFNGDGYPDILWLDSSGDLAVWLMSGSTVSSQISLGNVGTQWSVVGTGDFTGSGVGDILWRNTSTGDVSIWLMSNGQFSSGIDLGVVPLNWQVAGTGDFNNSGVSDILWRNTSTGDLSIWFLNNGHFSYGADLGTVPTTWSVVGTGDFNGDGTSDILWRDSSGDLAIWFLSNGGFASGASLGQVSTTWSVAETGDFNADGMSDILWLDSSGDLAVWLMNSGTLSSGISLGNLGTTWYVQSNGAD